ncbi:MAG: hypothetical protein ACRDOY_06225 [Nocardioidaceae bacterium]
MEILLWLAPPAAVTVLAMVWAGWAGREPRRPDRGDAVADARFAAAVEKPHPVAHRMGRPGTGAAPRNRAGGVGGVAVRRARPARNARTQR